MQKKQKRREERRHRKGISWIPHTWKNEQNLELATQHISGDVTYSLSICGQLKSCRASRKFWTDTFKDMEYLSEGYPVNDNRETHKRTQDSRVQPGRTAKGSIAYFLFRMNERYQQFLQKNEYDKKRTQCVDDIMSILRSPMWYARLEAIASGDKQARGSGPLARPKFPVKCPKRQSTRKTCKLQKPAEGKEAMA
jgi:hypothetical protein